MEVSYFSVDQRDIDFGLCHAGDDSGPGPILFDRFRWRGGALRFGRVGRVLDFEGECHDREEAKRTGAVAANC